MAQEQDGKSTLWMGSIPEWADETWIRQLWYSLGENVSVKMIRDKFTGGPANYCFIQFQSHAAAQKAVALHGTLIPNTDRTFKLNWASGGPNERGKTSNTSAKQQDGPEYSLFIGDLGPEVNESMIVAIFQSRYRFFKSARIMTDPATGMSRGYGFVRFTNEDDRNRALAECNGMFCGSRPMRISMATPKGRVSAPSGTGGAGSGTSGYSSGGAGGYGSTGGYGGSYPQAPQPPISAPIGEHTTIYVGGLVGYMTEEDLRSFFEPFGTVTHIKLPANKGFAFVGFMHQQSAEMAIYQANGAMFGNSRLQLQWAKPSPNNPREFTVADTPPVSAPAPLPMMQPYSNMPSVNPYPSADPNLLGAATGAYPAMDPNAVAPVAHLPTSLFDPMEPVPVSEINDSFIKSREGVLERLRDESSWKGIFCL
ncbi:uncharacterized protein VTP21DRAFT_6639 [Calcarisporiella thermophila]|uniref:uncharacterized protein n=1 Tax=Calcarisporiella thermophila TaxID=911321 RepID=UPI003744B1B0